MKFWLTEVERSSAEKSYPPNASGTLGTIGFGLSTPALPEGGIKKRYTGEDGLCPRQLRFVYLQPCAIHGGVGRADGDPPQRRADGRRGGGAQSGTHSAFARPMHPAGSGHQYSADSTLCR